MRKRVLGMCLEGGKVRGIGAKMRESGGEDWAERKRWVESRVKFLSLG